MFGLSELAVILIVVIAVLAATLIFRCPNVLSGRSSPGPAAGIAHVERSSS